MAALYRQRRQSGGAREQWGTAEHEFIIDPCAVVRSSDRMVGQFRREPSVRDQYLAARGVMRRYGDAREHAEHLSEDGHIARG